MTPKKQKKKQRAKAARNVFFCFLFTCSIALLLLLFCFFFAFVLRPLVGIAFLITFLVLFWRFFNCCQLFRDRTYSRTGNHNHDARSFSQSGVTRRIATIRKALNLKPNKPWTPTPVNPKPWDPLTMAEDQVTTGWDIRRFWTGSLHVHGNHRIETDNVWFNLLDHIWTRVFE